MSVLVNPRAHQTTPHLYLREISFTYQRAKLLLGSLAGNGSGGVYQLSVAPGATAQTGEFTVNIVRVGGFSRVFSSDPRFQIIPSPKGSARFVWPNPERDESPLTIERLYRKKANYEIESILRFLGRRDHAKASRKYRPLRLGWQ